MLKMMEAMRFPIGLLAPQNRWKMAENLGRTCIRLSPVNSEYFCASNVKYVPCDTQIGPDMIPTHTEEGIMVIQDGAQLARMKTVCEKKLRKSDHFGWKW